MDKKQNKVKSSAKTLERDEETVSNEKILRWGNKKKRTNTIICVLKFIITIKEEKRNRNRNWIFTSKNESK
jgi:hypothetical protein